MIVTLTDFDNSEYLGVMKGVILSLSHSANIIDLYNKVSPQNIKEAAWILLQDYKHFPKGAVFLCVVDPGVGGKRKAVAIKTKEYYFVGPDNGLMYPAALQDGIKEIVELLTKGASSTFQGRDVFAKIAAEIDKGAELQSLGKKISALERLSFHLNGREGEIVRIDNFGNIITNLKHIDKESYNVKCKRLNKRLNFYKTYSQAKDKELFAVECSYGTLEIAVKNGNANKKLKLRAGDLIWVG